MLSPIQSAAHIAADRMEESPGGERTGPLGLSFGLLKEVFLNGPAVRQQEEELQAGVNYDHGPNPLWAMFTDFLRTRNAVATMRKIVDGGLSPDANGTANIPIREIIEFLNYGHDCCKVDDPHYEPIKEFLRDYGAGLFKAALDKVRTEAGVDVREQTRLKNEITFRVIGSERFGLSQAVA